MLAFRSNPSSVILHPNTNRCRQRIKALAPSWIVQSEDAAPLSPRVSIHVEPGYCRASSFSLSTMGKTYINQDVAVVAIIRVLLRTELWWDYSLLPHLSRTRHHIYKLGHPPRLSLHQALPEVTDSISTSIKTYTGRIVHLPQTTRDYEVLSFNQSGRWYFNLSCRRKWKCCCL